MIAEASVFLLALLIWLAVPFVDRWERSRDERDREAWDRYQAGDRW